MSHPYDAPFLDDKAIEGLLNEIGHELAQDGKVMEIALYGGAALRLLFNNRPSTRDLDFVLMSGDLYEITEASDIVGLRHGFPEGWFNDAVEGFQSDKPDHIYFGDFPRRGPAGLRVFLASAEYIMAMKMLRMRSSMESNDVLDIWNLFDHCGVKNIDQANQWLHAFFPNEDLPTRCENIIHDIFAAKERGEVYSPMIGW